jgi:hypothetical protein
VLFQTYYRMTPWEFEPALLSAEGVSLRSRPDHFGFRLLSRWDPDEEEQEIVGVALLEQEIDPPIREVLQATTLQTVKPAGGPDGLQGFSNEYASFVRGVLKTLDSLATRAFDLLAWRYRFRGGPIQLTSHVPGLRWAQATWTEVPEPFDAAWRRVPHRMPSIELGEMGELQPADAELQSLSELLGSSQSAPLGQNLLRVAWPHVKSDPRTALVMAIAAAETWIQGVRRGPGTRRSLVTREYAIASVGQAAQPLPSALGNPPKGRRTDSSSAKVHSECD